MPQPSKKALLSCATLLTACSAGASAHAADLPVPTVDTDGANLVPDLPTATAAAQADAVEVAVLNNAQTIAPTVSPQNAQPSFASAPAAAPVASEAPVVASLVTEPTVAELREEERQQKLDRLVSGVIDRSEPAYQAAPPPVVRPEPEPEVVSVAEPLDAGASALPAPPATVAQTPALDSSGAVGDSFSPESLPEEELRQQLLVDTPVSVEPRPVPGSSFGTPTAYGASQGDAYVGIAGVTEGDQSDVDGSISLGVGFGDPIESVGVEVGAGIISLDGFAEDGQIGVKLHKIFPEANNLAVAVGWSNPITWGAADDAEDTVYGVVTKSFDLQPGQENPLPLTVSAGVGTGAYRSTGAIAAGTNDPNLFGSVGLRVLPELSVASSWTGSALNLGLSAAPFDIPLVLNAGVTDVTSNTNEGPRFSASMGYRFSF